MNEDKNINDIVQYVQQKFMTRFHASSRNQFDNQQLLAIRSSSTLEDLDEMTGAGLFDSILNVGLND